MSIASTIAVSGLSVASLRLQVAASNIANTSSDGPLPGTPNPQNFPPAYSALRVNQVANLGGGTSNRHQCFTVYRHGVRRERALRRRPWHGGEPECRPR
jgi:hypothetical protein